MHSNVWALLLALSIPAAAADGAAKGWDRIGQIPKTQSVTINLQDGKTLKGKIQETGAEGLTLIQGSAVRQVKRTEIATVPPPLPPPPRPPSPPPASSFF